MIEITDISKSYNGQKVLDHVSLSLPRGGLTSLIGPNGAGKSTLLTMISRLIAPDSGTISVDGLDVHRCPSDVLARRLSILRQENAINCRLSVGDLISFGRYPHSKGRLTREDKTHIDEAIAYLELEPFRDRFLDELSGGQRQRAFIAMVLCQNTDYILLDEPLNNLDMKHSVAMMKLLRRAADELNKTILIILHDVNFASCYSDRIIAMRDGKILAQGPAAEVMRRESLRDIYDLDIAVKTIHDRRIAVYYE